MACWQTLWYESWFVSIWSLWYMMSGIWVPSQNWFRHLYLGVLFQVLLIFLWLICKSTVVVPCYVGGHVVCGVNEGLVAGQTFVFYSEKKQYMLDHNIFASEWSLNLVCVTWETLAIFCIGLARDITLNLGTCVRLHETSLSNIGWRRVNI